MNKYKGDLSSVFILLIFIVITLFGSLIYANLSGEIGTELATTVSEMNLDNEYAENVANAMIDDSISIADDVAFWLLIAVILGLIISGLFLDFEPVIVGLMILFSALAVYGSMQVANMYHEFYINSEELTATALAMSKTATVYGTALPIIIFITFIVSLIVMYARKGRAYGQ